LREGGLSQNERGDRKRSKQGPGNICSTTTHTENGDRRSKTKGIDDKCENEDKNEKEIESEVEGQAESLGNHHNKRNGHYRVKQTQRGKERNSATTTTTTATLSSATAATATTRMARVRRPASLRLRRTQPSRVGRSGRERTRETTPGIHTYEWQWGKGR